MTDIATEDVMRKIRGLLRQAENTPYEDEAIAFLTKAQQLMFTNAIDEETLWESEPDKRPKPVIRTLVIATNTAGAMWLRAMLNACAKANRCKMWYQASDNSVAGFENDVIYVEMLYTSIKVQMNFAMVGAIAQNQVFGQRTKTFKANFIAGFSNRIYSRLMEMKEKQDAYRGTGMELVVNRSKAIDDFVKATVGELGSSKASSSGAYDHKASMAGRAAADATDISGGKNTLTSRKALPT